MTPEIKPGICDSSCMKLEVRGLIHSATLAEILEISSSSKLLPLKLLLRGLAGLAGGNYKVTTLAVVNKSAYSIYLCICA